MNKKITFPHMGNYHVPVKYLLEHICDAEIIVAPPITAKTIELGAKYSPEFVCTPFKYTLGTLIEGLEAGATVLMQAGGGCRYGYYSELQEQILKELGYEFEFYNFVSEGRTKPKEILKKMRQINPKFSLWKGLYYLGITTKMIRFMDLLDEYIRNRIGFEVQLGSFEQVQTEFLEALAHTKGYFHLRHLYKKYRRKFASIRVKKPEKPLKIGIIGELYTVMEPFSNYQIEKTLARYGIEVKRFTNAHYLLFEKKKQVPKYLNYAKEYIQYRMGADAADNIGRAKYLCCHGYDGIIHIKSSFCTPEIGAMPILQKISREYNVPILFFSFDAATSEVGVETRLEAFYDMLTMRRES